MKNLYPRSRTGLLCLLMITLSLTSLSQQIPKSILASTGDQIGFLEYKPSNYDQDVSTKYPLIIFLHGIGERGNGTTDLQLVTTWGIPARIKSGYNMRFSWNGKAETFLVISPQLPTKYGMWPSAIIDDLINYAKKNLRVDTDRILLTGLSMGGGGTFRYISDALPQDPWTIAAAVTISSPCTFKSGKEAAAAHLPVWSFHAMDDGSAPVTCTINAINGLNQWNPVVKPMLTLWPSGGHNVWDRLYGDTSYVYQDVVNIYEWLLAQNKSLPANQLPVANAGPDANVQAGTVTLNGSASYDPDGKIVRYVWKRLSGPSSGTITTPRGAGASTTVTSVTTPGVYSYELAVADNRASFTRDTVKITVTAGAPAPAPPPVATPPPTTTPPASGLVASAGADVTVTGWDQNLLNASLTTSAGGWITSVRWSKISGPSTYAITDSTALITHATNLVVGVYTFRVTIVDTKGRTASDDKTVTVLSVPSTPSIPLPTSAGLKADAGADAVLNGWNQNMLNASLTTSEGGWIKTLLWTKVSGPAKYSITSPSSLITYATSLAVGTYVFRVTITDTKGRTAYDEKTVKVLAVAAGLSAVLDESFSSSDPSKASNGMSASPNPATSSLVLQYASVETGKVLINIFDVTGKRVKTITTQKYGPVLTQRLDVSNLAKGSYFIEAGTGKEAGKTIKIVKQ